MALGNPCKKKCLTMKLVGTYIKRVWVAVPFARPHFSRPSRICPSVKGRATQKPTRVCTIHHPTCINRQSMEYDYTYP